MIYYILMLTSFLFLILLSIIFFCNSIMSTYISMEFMVSICFIVIYMFMYMENYLEILLFLMMAVGESLLGLTILLMKVMFTGKDFFEMLNVV